MKTKTWKQRNSIVVVVERVSANIIIMIRFHSNKTLFGDPADTFVCIFKQCVFTFSATGKRLLGQMFGKLPLQLKHIDVFVLALIILLVAGV